MSLSTISCRKLPAFDEANLDAVRAAFQAAPTLAFAQAWLPQPETDFLPGTARFDGHNETLFALAQLSDIHIFTRVVPASIMRSQRIYWQNYADEVKPAP